MAFEDFGLLVARYNSSAPSLSNGDLTELQVDSNGRLLVQADVSVVIDFLGLNGAGDSSNILMVGTEDGTSGGTAHAVRLASNGAVVIDDGGSSITVDATDLDIRDLNSTQDEVGIGDGTDFLEVNSDGSINVVASQDAQGTEEYSVADGQTANEDGLIDISAGGFTDVASLSITSGETAYVYGWQFAADGNAVARLITDDTTDVVVYKTSLNSSATPSYNEHWSESGRIEIVGAASLTLKLQVRQRGGSGANNATGSIHVRKS